MYKRVRHILMLIILISGALPALAQIVMPDSVCVGTTRHYWVVGTSGSTYTWKINGAIKGSTTDFIDVIWDISGLFNIEVQEHQENCSGEIQTGLIKVVPPPIAFAGNLSTICYGNVFTLSEATAQNFSKLLWTTSGDGTFDNAVLLQPVYNLGPNDLLTGKILLTLTAEGLGDGLTCSPAVSTVELNIIRYQSTVRHTDVTCFGANNGIISIENSLGGSGNYEFTVNGTTWSGSTEYTDRAPGKYIVQMRDVLPPSCITTIDTILITEPDPLTATTEFKNASCLGDDGTISVFPHGGSGAFEFALNGIGWQTAGYFAGLIPGTYLVHISDANVPNCSAIVDTIIITKPPPVTATVVQTNVSCFDGNDGNITISDPKNGSPGDYRFSIDGVTWNSGMVFGNLFAGEYIVQMLDINAITCVETIASITITQPAKLIATVAKTNVTCFGGNNGSLIVSNSSGGSGSFEYLIEGKSWTTNGSFTGLIAGKYNLQMRDFKTPSCMVLIGEYEITEPLQLMASVAAKDISCYGSKDGNITITDAKNGVPAYQYSIDGTWKDNSLFSGLGPNTYLVRMRDANGCIQDLDTIVIIEPKPLTAVVDSTNATCLGNDGTITITNPENSVSGFYEYSIDGIKWTSNGSFTDLVAKTYYVQIRDSLLITCEQIIDTIMITEPASMLATATKTNVKCFGGNDGTITVSGQSGGSTVYQYSIDGFNWVDQPLFTGLVSKSYTIQMRDAKANECLITVGTYLITEPGQLSATAVPKHLICFGGNNGAINFANQKGGSGNYEYSMNGIDWVVSKIDLLIAGFYTVQMRDADVPACMVTLGQVEIKQPKKLTAMVEPSNVSCFGGSDGTITITNPINGIGPFQYSVDGGTTWQSSGIFTGLKAGVYPMMMVQDANNCIATISSVEINQPDQLVATATRTNETVTGANDGTITIIGVNGGSGNYDYSINGTDWQFTPGFIGLKPDTYTILIRDASTEDCKITRTVIILPSGAISAIFISTPVTCYNGNDGTITFSGASGATSFEYSIDGGDTWQSSPNFVGLTAQNYLLTVHDALIPSNRADLGNIQLKQPAVLNAVITASSESFAGAADGVITISAPTGGSGVYEYSIDGTSWSTAMTYSNLTSKTYTVWIRDISNPDCKISIPKIVHIATALAADVISTDITCNVKNGGTNNGSITINSASGATDYEYSKDDGASWQTSGDFTDLGAGTYKTMLRDKANISNKVALDVIIINEPKVLEALLSPTLPLCAGTTGTVSVFARGGTGTFVGTGKFVMAAGETRIFSVRDENGCTASAPYTMPTPLKIVVKAVVIPSKCFSVDGTVTITATGGTGVLNGTGTFPVKSGRNYNYIVTDDNGCLSNMISGVMPVTPPKLEASVAPADLLCFGTTGSLKVTAIGGSGSYTYLWDDPAKQTTQTATGLVPGNYTVTITDKNGCPSITVNGTVEEPSAEIIAIAGVTAQPSCLVPKGTIEFTAPIGVIYEYSTDGILFQDSPLFTDLDPAGYSGKVREKLSKCESKVIALTVNQIPDAPAKPVASITHPNCLVDTGIIEVTDPLGATYEYSIDGITWQSSPVFTGRVPDIYSVKVKDTATQCESAVTTLTVDPVPVPPVPPVAIVTHPNCVLTTGTIKITDPIGAAYQYSLNGKPYQLNPVFAGLAPGDYSIKVKGTGIGCETTAIIVLVVDQVPLPPVAPVAKVTQPTCILPTGTIEVSSPIGIAYQYSLDGKAYQTSPVFAGLAPGSTHTVKVNVPATKCESLTTTVKIDQIIIPPTPVAVVQVKPNCIVPTGTIGVNSPIGTNYQYSIDGGVYQTAASFAGLAPLSSHTIKVKEISTGCVSVGTTIKIDQMPVNPAAPVAKVTVPPTCNNKDGTVVVTSPAGPNYVYTINGITHDSTEFAGLDTDTYTITVTNILTGCISTGSIVVPAIPPAPVLTVTATEDCLCYEGKGSISFNITNALPGIYTIKYDGGEFSNVNIIGTKAKVAAFAGTYNNLTIIANGCNSYDPKKLVNATVNQPKQIVISEKITPIDLKSGRKGMIDLTVTGGTGSKYQVLWHPDASIGYAGATTEDISNLDNGLYIVTVTDQNGCTQSDTITIPVPNFPPVAVNDKFISSCNVVTGDLLANDSDTEGDPIFIDVVPVTRPLHGTVTLNPDGTFEYIADAHFDGTDSLRYAIYDVNHYQGDTAIVLLQIILDTDQDGIADANDPDADGDGILNINEGDLVLDSDGDGFPNYLDIDADGDGIVDNIEAQSTANYIPPSYIDLDGNGIDDAYDKNQGGTEIIPVDTDGDGIPDFLDTDSDADGVSDYIEGHDSNSDGKPDVFALGKDSDGDGLDDAYDTFIKLCIPSGNVTGSNAPLQDFDHDLIRDWRDDDDDNDKILTKWEDLNGDGIFSNDDIGHPGHPEYLYFGRDCELFIPDAFSPNGDNVHDYFQIYCIDQYPNAKMYIFDQLGNKLYEKPNYGNLDVWKTFDHAWWSGKSEIGPANTRNVMVPPGTYYYVLDLGNGEVRKSYVFVSY